MAALTPTDVKQTEFAGDVKVKFYTVVIMSSTDTVDLSSDFDTLYSVTGQLEAGADAALNAGLQVSFSGTTATIESFEQDGTPATDWTSASVRLTVIGAN